MPFQYMCPICTRAFPSPRRPGSVHSPTYCSFACRSACPEYRAKVGAAHKGLKWGPETLAKISFNSRNRSPETRAKLSAAARKATYTAERRAKISMRSRNASPETRAKLSIATARRNAASTLAHGGTSIERILIAFLTNAGYIVIPQKQFGRRVVDAYLPDYHLAFEADGSYWHNRPGVPEKDAARDAELLRHFQLPVVRLTDHELAAITS